MAEEIKELESEELKGEIGYDPETLTIYINGAISEDSGMIFAETVKAITSDENFDNEITIELSSEGGCLRNGLRICSEIERLKEKEITVVIKCVDMAYSMGLCILMCGSKGHRFIDRNAQTLFHSPLLYIQNGYCSIGEHEKRFKNHMNHWNAFKKITLSNSNVSESWLNKIKNQDLDYFMDAEETINRGFADSIY